MSYANIFGGYPVNPAFLSYIQYSLTVSNSPLQLTWPTEFVNTENNVSCIIEVTANTTGLSLVMPNATYVSVGQAVLFVNVGANTVTVYENDGVTPLLTLTSAQSTYAYLINNSTANGSWRTIAWGGGSAGVVTVAAVSTSTDLVITGSPITNAGTFTFSLAEDLLALTSFGAGTGIAVRTAANTWSLRTIIGTANQIVVTNGNGVAGNPTLALAQNISGITSVTASNIQIGVNGTNRIDTSNGAPLLFNVNLGIENQHALDFYDSTDIGYVGFQAPTNVTTNVVYTLPPAPPTTNGYVLSSTTGGVMSWVAGGGSGGNTSTTVTQTGHGFVVGDIVYYTGTAYAKAKADSVVTAEVVGVVETIIDANTFVLVTDGFVTTLTGLTSGDVYFLSDVTAGLATTTQVTTVGNIDKPIWQAVSTTAAILLPYRGKIVPTSNLASTITNNYRLTLTSGVPVTTNSVTAATTIYLTPYKGNDISLYSGTGSSWIVYYPGEISIAVPATTNQMYDIFAYNNAGTVTLELVAWTNDTTRATALTTQNGVYVKTGSLTHRYLGSFRTTGVAGQTEDSDTNRLLWNYYNRVNRFMGVFENTFSWVYTTATWRQANANSANQLNFVIGVVEDCYSCDVSACASNNTITIVNVGIGLNSTTSPLGPTAEIISSVTTNSTMVVQPFALSKSLPTLGYNYLAWLEYSVATGATTWYGEAGQPNSSSGINATILS